MFSLRKLWIYIRTVSGDNDYEIYLEHFALNKNNEAPSFFKNPSGYYSQYLEKIKVHKNNKTKLITTFSWEKSEGKLLKNLEKKLKKHNVKFKRMKDSELLNIFKSSGKLNTFTELISTFMSHYKSNELDEKKVKEKIQIPLIAAGGIATGKGMLAAMVLGADGVQIGSRFVASEESSAHINFKNKVIAAEDGDTLLTLKELAPVRLLKNKFSNDVLELYKSNPSKQDLIDLLGRARAKRGMFEGDLEDGELEIGQITGLINKIQPASKIVKEIISEFNFETNNLKGTIF